MIVCFSESLGHVGDDSDFGIFVTKLLVDMSIQYLDTSQVYSLGAQYAFTFCTVPVAIGSVSRSVDRISSSQAQCSSARSEKRQLVLFLVVEAICHKCGYA